MGSNLGDDAVQNEVPETKAQPDNEDVTPAKTTKARRHPAVGSGGPGRKSKACEWVLEETRADLFADSILKVWRVRNSR